MHVWFELFMRWQLQCQLCLRPVVVVVWNNKQCDMTCILNNNNRKKTWGVERGSSRGWFASGCHENRATKIRLCKWRKDWNWERKTVINGSLKRDWLFIDGSDEWKWLYCGLTKFALAPLAEVELKIGGGNAAGTSGRECWKVWCRRGGHTWRSCWSGASWSIGQSMGGQRSTRLERNPLARLTEYGLVVKSGADCWATPEQPSEGYTHVHRNARLRIRGRPGPCQDETTPACAASPTPK